MAMSRHQLSRKKLFEPVETFKVYNRQMEVTRKRDGVKNFKMYNTATLPELLTESREIARKNSKTGAVPALIGVRAILDLGLKLIFGREGIPNKQVPSHYEMANACYCADDIYFNEANQIAKINNKSSGFLPDFISVQLIILQLYIQGYKFAPEVIFVNIHSNGENAAFVSHIFKQKKLFKLLDILIEYYKNHNPKWVTPPTLLELTNLTASETSPVKSTSTTSIIKTFVSPFTPNSSERLNQTYIASPVPAATALSDIDDEKLNKRANRALTFGSLSSGSTQTAAISDQKTGIESPPQPVRKKLFSGILQSSTSYCNMYDNNKPFTPLVRDMLDISSSASSRLNDPSEVMSVPILDGDSSNFKASSPFYSSSSQGWSLPYRPSDIKTSLPEFAPQEDLSNPIVTYDSSSESDNEDNAFTNRNRMSSR